MGRWQVICGDNREHLRTLDDASVDAVVTDPPYELGFMGKAWDASGIAYDVGLWREVLRVLKPGGHCLAFGATRTYHRLAVAIEDAGFEIRDSIHWVYGSGFPKGLRPVPHMWQYAKSCLSKERVQHVVQVSPPIRPAFQEGKERTALALAVIQPEGVPALLTETGKADGSSEVTVTLLSESAMQRAVTDWSMISSWRGSLDDGFDVVNMSITETISNTTIVQKILSYLTGQTTPSSTRHSAILPDGSKWPACDAGALLSEERLKSQLIPVLTALATATKNPLCEFAGWNVNLKPAHEPIVVARKPLTGTVAANVLAHGVGGINVDGCRVAAIDGGSKVSAIRSEAGINKVYGRGLSNPGPVEYQTPAAGRWPPNVVFSHLPACDPEACAEGCAVAELDAQSGTLTSGSRSTGVYKTQGYGKAAPGLMPGLTGDTGGASRFFPAFRYQAKPSRAERDAGLRDAKAGSLRLRTDAHSERTGQTTAPRANTHATVKPVELMRWLVRLITPPGGLVLDPFTGSGTTGMACLLEGFRFLGMEKEEEYHKIAVARIAEAQRKMAGEQLTLFDLV